MTIYRNIKPCENRLKGNSTSKLNNAINSRKEKRKTTIKYAK